MGNLSIGIRKDMVNQVVWHAQMSLDNPVIGGFRIEHMLKVLAKMRRATWKVGEDCSPIDDAIMFFIERYPAYDANEDNAVVEQFLREPAARLKFEFVTKLIPE